MTKKQLEKQKRRVSRYVEEMNVWIAQRLENAATCRLFAATHRREIKNLLRRKDDIHREIAARRRSIVLELNQLTMIGRSVREVKREVAKYLKSRG